MTASLDARVRKKEAVASLKSLMRLQASQPVPLSLWASCNPGLRGSGQPIRVLAETQLQRVAQELQAQGVSRAEL